GQPAHRHLVERPLGQDGDAVEALLPVHGAVVAERLEGLGGKRLVGALDLLEAGDLGVRLLEPGNGTVDARLDAVDVPGGDLHGVVIGSGVTQAPRSLVNASHITRCQFTPNTSAVCTQPIWRVRAYNASADHRRGQED